MKLTKTEKEKIVNRALNDVFKVKEQKLQLAREKLALDIYETIFSADERRMISSLPAGWMLTRTNLRVYGLSQRQLFNRGGAS